MKRHIMKLLLTWEDNIALRYRDACYSDWSAPSALPSDGDSPGTYQARGHTSHIFIRLQQCTEHRVKPPLQLLFLIILMSNLCVCVF